MIRNDGNLPASKVSWFIDKKFSSDEALGDKCFKIGPMHGSVIVPAHGFITKGGKAIPFTEFDAERGRGPDKDGRGPWMYVFGRIEYHDGFRDGRWVQFCHRYNLKPADDRRIPADDGRHHESGNDTDQSKTDQT